MGKMRDRKATWVALNDDEKAQVRTFAEQKGLNMSSAIRMLLLEAFETRRGLGSACVPQEPVPAGQPGA